MMGERGIWGLLKTAAEVVGPPRTSDVGLLSDRKIAQTEGYRDKGAGQGQLQRTVLRVVFKGPML